MPDVAADRVAEQRAESLALANRKRLAAAAARREIAALSFDDGRRCVARLLRNRDDRIQSLRIGLLLRSIRHLGRVSLRRLLTVAAAGSEDRQVQELTDRQVEELARDLLDWRNVWPGSEAACYPEEAYGA